MSDPRKSMAEEDDEDYDWANAPTIRADSEPIKKMLAEGLAPELLTAASTEDKAGLDRVALCVESIQGPMVLYVYGGETMVLGRDPEKSDLRLALRPEDQYESQSQRISPEHLRFEVIENGVTVQDLISSEGTLLDGEPLPSGESHVLSPEAELQVGEVLDLQCFILPRSTIRALAVNDKNDQVSSAPALFIERPNNGHDCAYALVPGRLVLTMDETGRLRGSTGTTGCEAEIFFFDGQLWLSGGGLPEGECRVLSDRSDFVLGTIPVSVRAFNAQD